MLSKMIRRVHLNVHRDFGDFVANASKEVKWHVLESAANRAMREQRKIVSKAGVVKK